MTSTKMPRKRALAIVSTLAATLAFLAIDSAVAQQQAARLRTGELRCNVAAGVAVVVGSRALSCTFRPNKGKRETYTGRLTKVGLNLGVTGKGVLVWGVLEPAGHHAVIDGTYVGATGEASLGAGIGANALLGGTNDSVALQPLSIQGQTGLNVAAGVASLELRAER